jgi:hypothetical protein
VTRAVVVDTSVARSAGGPGPTHARSVACRDALGAMREASVHAVVSPALLDEYLRQEHQSTFFRKWLATMRSKRQVIETDARPSRDLRLAAGRLPPSARAAVEKDLLLVSAAQATDDRVLSCDDTVRAHLAVLAADVRPLGRLHWANPEAPGCVAWLGAGAHDDRTWMLAPP